MPRVHRKKLSAGSRWSTATHTSRTAPTTISESARLIKVEVSNVSTPHKLQQTTRADTREFDLPKLKDHSSWPCLSWPSSLPFRIQDVDPRHKAGHDDDLFQPDHYTKRKSPIQPCDQARRVPALPAHPLADTIASQGKDALGHKATCPSVKLAGTEASLVAFSTNITS
jgi:hypothetical protein